MYSTVNKHHCPFSTLTVTRLARVYSITEPSTYKHESVNTIIQEVQFNAIVNAKEKMLSHYALPQVSGIRYGT